MNLDASYLIGVRSYIEILGIRGSSLTPWATLAGIITKSNGNLYTIDLSGRRIRYIPRAGRVGSSYRFLKTPSAF